MSGPSFFYERFFRLLLQYVLNSTQSLLTCYPSLAQCFDASLSCSDASQSGLRCASVRPCHRWRQACLSSEVSALLSSSSQLTLPHPRVSLANTLVSPWFRSTDCKMAQFVWARVTVAGAGMLWRRHTLGTAQIMFRDRSLEISAVIEAM